MIGRLRGELVWKQPPSLLVDVGGVGYEVEAPMSTFYDLPSVGEPVELLTHVGVRDEVQVLYAFLRRAERELFRALIRVSGIGAKMALTILSGATPAEFARLIDTADAAALTRLPGIGKKTADRLIVEMRDRLDTLPGVRGDAPATTPSASPLDPAGEACEALIALGYKPPDATRMVSRVAEDGMPVEEIIRAALRGVVGDQRGP